ncbi:hypothetical protein DPMN_020797 [Dreissena polymorpha]|uniref:Uncharacterized protein n=1 Tax=Dreissena polymorpha TaxID=45954 RepID=A0A9D4NMS1_DREPO|nr:hypothetical protein DPMN_020797 [Dreissena polymorpha]
MGLDSHCSKKVYGFKVKKMTSQRDIQDCRDEMTHASRGSQDTIREFPATYLLVWEHLQSQQVNQRQSSSPDSEIPMLHNPQSMNIMHSKPWTSIDEIKPANQKDSLLLQLLSY